MAADRQRPNATKRGYDRKWQKASANFLKLPGNERCACGCSRSADMVDHRVAPKGDMKLFWDRTNWQPYALVCNTRKGIREEGGFGRPRAASPATQATGAPSETFSRDAVTARGPRRETPRNIFSPDLEEKETTGPRFY